MRIAMIGAAMIAAGVAVPARAQDPNHARNIAATCTACHGTEGRSVGGIPPSLAGQSKDYLLQALKDFKEGKRAGTTIMHQHAKGYTDQQLELIAGYFSSMKAGPGAAAPAAR
ncbi:MAG TPA: c-type cytochrome [Burkholderiales bacterium]|nr:c-type cytochrome [Burkholderiales bacterium]